MATLSLHAVDSSSLAYVTDFVSSQVYVVDALTGVATGTVSTTGFEDFQSPREVAISSDGSFALVTDMVLLLMLQIEIPLEAPLKSILAQMH